MNSSAKKVIYILFLIVSTIAVCACEKKSILQPPIAETSTPAPSPTLPPVTPLPAATSVNPEDFFEVLRLLAPGTKVVLDGMSEEDIKRCFYIEEYPAAILMSLEKAGLCTDESVKNPMKFRGLVRISDTEAVIGEVLVSQNDAREFIEKAYAAFSQKSGINANPSGDALALSVAGTSGIVKSVYAENRLYYAIIYK